MFLLLFYLPPSNFNDTKVFCVLMTTVIYQSVCVVPFCFLFFSFTITLVKCVFIIISRNFVLNVRRRKAFVIKMPKGKELSCSEKKIILYLHDKGKSIKYICEMFDRCRQTIENVIKRAKERGNIQNIPRKGRPKLLTIRNERQILKENRENPHLSAPKINEKLKGTLRKSVCDETVRRVVRANNINGRVARKKPFISEVNRQKRLAFAELHKSKPFDFWKTVIFSDESKYKIFGSDGRRMVWRKPNEALNIKNIKPTVKHGGGSVMVWGCMSALGVGKLVFIEGIMDRHVYLTILKENLNASVEKMGLSRNGYYFQHDNDPKHTAWDVKMWLLYNTKHLPTPPQSPDMNPIENLWAYLKEKVREHHISSKAKLKKVLEEEWYKIPPEKYRNLVESMPRRLESVLANKGYPTKY